jgi:XrtJ-associated TM-motif-TM protein
MRLRSLLFLSFAILLLAIPAHAQTGCLDSPECPTAVLATVGIAGSAAARMLLSRWRRK